MALTNLHLLNSHSAKNYSLSIPKHLNFSHSSGFHCLVSTSTEPIDREDNEQNTQQPPRNKPNVHESNMKFFLQEIVKAKCKQVKHSMCKHCKTSFKNSYRSIHYDSFGAPDGKKADIQRCKELMQDRVLHDIIRVNVIHAKIEVKKADAAIGAKDDAENIVQIARPSFLLIKFCYAEGLKKGEV
ncbi:hypothetical protein Cgig2_022602 [Carnegiea gigantea]|uniref:Uncharacterized protein n=1 Tax=Carnegiea gigantea TaxID=171969 RepID=A0A9Q1GTT7_9CARY|nr:hypothetical protein Cgig2_022602 [Carnegiea gigantea]